MLRPEQVMKKRLKTPQALQTVRWAQTYPTGSKGTLSIEASEAGGGGLEAL